MSTTVGRFQPPSVKVSITDGRTQVTFDRPEDFIAWLTAHPELKDEAYRWSWTTQDVQGGS